MINLHERMLPTSAGVEPATSWSPVGRASNCATEAGTKFEKSHIWYALVVMDITYAIIKVHLTEPYDVIKHHSNVITIWRTSAINVTAWLQISTFRNERCARKRIYHGCEGYTEKSVPCDHSLTSLCKPCDARQWSLAGQTFLSTPHTYDRSLYLSEFFFS